MARVLIIETGDDWRALAVPDGWDSDDVDRYLNGQPYGRAAVVAVESMREEMVAGGVRDALGGWQDDGEDPDTFLPSRPGEPYGGGV